MEKYEAYELEYYEEETQALMFFQVLMNLQSL